MPSYLKADWLLHVYATFYANLTVCFIPCQVATQDQVLSGNPHVYECTVKGGAKNWLNSVSIPILVCLRQ